MMGSNLCKKLLFPYTQPRLLMYRLEPNKDYRNHNQTHTTPLAGDALKADTSKHYDECYSDYLFAWCNSDNLALHYGYWDESTPYKQHQALLNKNQILYEKATFSLAIKYWMPAAALAAVASGWPNNRAIPLQVSPSAPNKLTMLANMHTDML
jgi:hypothetical protein